MSSKTVPGTPSWLRETNDRKALELLFEHGPLTRNRIGTLSGLSKPTASLMVARLESAGLISAVGEVSVGRGPNAATYAVRPERVLGIAVNINHQEIQSTVVDALGTEMPIVKATLAKTARERDAVEEVSDAIRSACEAAQVPVESVKFTCIGVQGAFDRHADELSFVEALPGWPRKGIRKQLEDALGHNVIIDNDVNLAAIAERANESSADVSGFALLWMGEGLGLAVDLGGIVYRGASGSAGEIGYLPVPRIAADIDPDAKDLQSFVGAAAVAKVAKTYGLRQRGYSALLEELSEHPSKDDVFSELASRIAVGVIPVLAVLDPERVVLGGPTGALGGKRLASLVQSTIRRESRWAPEVVTTAVPDHPVVRGAREVLITHIRNVLIGEVNMIAP